MTDKVENTTKPAAAPVEESGLSSAVVDKYKSAAKIVDETLKALVPLLVDGANVLDLVREIVQCQVKS